MNARQARELAKKANCKSLPQIYEAITNAAEKGEMKTFFYKLLSTQEIDELVSLGYRVSQGTDRDGILVTIEWTETQIEWTETPVDKPV